MSEELNLDLDKLLEGVKPPLLTPSLGDISSLPNARKPKQIARIIVSNLYKQLGNPPLKEILHNGSVHQMRYFDIEPLMKGVWAEVSLLILPLSYGEQVTLIDAIYPADVQLTAKTFAAHFTKSGPIPRVTVEPDDKTRMLLETANSGIAFILAGLIQAGYTIAHPDVAGKYLNDMKQVAQERMERDDYREKMKRKKEADRHRDKQ